MDGDARPDNAGAGTRDVQCCPSRMGCNIVMDQRRWCFCIGTCDGVAYSIVSLESGNGGHACLWTDDAIGLSREAQRLDVVSPRALLRRPRERISAARSAYCLRRVRSSLVEASTRVVTPGDVCCRDCPSRDPRRKCRRSISRNAS